MSTPQKKFQNTVVDWMRSQAQITDFLQKQGIEMIQFTNTPGHVVLGFIAYDKKDNHPIPIRMRLPVPQNDEREVRRIYRVFYWYLTNKFEAIRSGIVEEIEKEFLPFIAFKTKNGVDTTLYEALKEEGNAILGDQGFSKRLLGNGTEEGEVIE